MLELKEGSSISEIISFAQETDKAIDEADIWQFIVQAVFMLKEFRRFGAINCKMAAVSLVWGNNKKLTYYPRSFSGLFSNQEADLEGIIYAPEGTDDQLDQSRSDVYNLGLAVLCIMDPDTEYFDQENKCFNMDAIRTAQDQKLNIFGDNPVNGYSDNLNALVHDMLVINPSDRPDLGNPVSSRRNYRKFGRTTRIRKSQKEEP